MNLSSKLRRLWWQLKFDSFLTPMLAGWAVFAAAAPWIGAGWFYTALLLWGALWAFLEHMAPRGWPRGQVRLLTPYFWAVKDLSGCWRIFQRRPKQSLDCKTALRGFLEEQKRLPAALTSGQYRALTHETILNRLRQMPNVTILSCRPAYVTTLEETVNQAMGKRCRNCSERCPFPGRKKPRQFYDVRWEIIDKTS